MSTSSGEQWFPCTSCGAEVAFAPGVSMLACPYCGETTDIPLDDDARVEELCLDRTLRDLDECADTVDRIVSHCDTCGADVEFPENVTSHACPFCSSNVVAVGRSIKQIRPGAVLPFAIDQHTASASYLKWIARRPFAPRDLKTMSTLNARLTGVYLPYWTFDADVNTDYRGRRGDAYYVTQTYTTVVNGKSVRRTRQVRKIRWTSVRGSVFDRFDDVLIIAADSVPRSSLEKLAPWSLKSLAPYNDSYLAGFSAESYALSLPSGFAAARTLMEQQIKVTIRRDIGGDEQQITQMVPRYSAMTFKHILLPVWIMAYRYHDKTYQVLVNGQSGEVIGKHPYSWFKISSLIIILLIVFAVIILIMSTR